MNGRLEHNSDCTTAGLYEVMRYWDGNDWNQDDPAHYLDALLAEMETLIGVDVKTPSERKELK